MLRRDPDNLVEEIAESEAAGERLNVKVNEFKVHEIDELVPTFTTICRTKVRRGHIGAWTDVVLKLLAERGLVKGKRIGLDASTMEANAALRTIVRREDGRIYREMLTQMAKESGLDDRSRGQDRRAERSHAPGL